MVQVNVLSLKFQLEKESYYPGEKVKGVLSVNVPHPIRARKVQITLEGKERVSFERHGRGGPYIHEENNIIVEKSINVWEAPEGGGEFGQSNALFPFEVQIPENAPPSVSMKDPLFNGITYELIAKIDKPLAEDPVAHYEILVLPRDRDSYVIKPVVMSHREFSGKMRVAVHIDKNVYVPGEHVTGKASLRRDSSLSVQDVEISLVYTITHTASGNDDPFRHVVGTIQCEIDPSVESFEWPFDFETPEDARFSVHGKMVKRLWEIEVRVNLIEEDDKILDVPILIVPRGGES